MGGVWRANTRNRWGRANRLLLIIRLRVGSVSLHKRRYLDAPAVEFDFMQPRIAKRRCGAERWLSGNNEAHAGRAKFNHTATHGTVVSYKRAHALRLPTCIILRRIWESQASQTSRGLVLTRKKLDSKLLKSTASFQAYRRSP